MLKKLKIKCRSTAYFLGSVYWFILPYVSLIISLFPASPYNNFPPLNSHLTLPYFPLSLFLSLLSFSSSSPSSSSSSWSTLHFLSVIWASSHLFFLHCLTFYCIFWGATLLPKIVSGCRLKECCCTVRVLLLFYVLYFHFYYYCVCIGCCCCCNTTIYCRRNCLQLEREILACSAVKLYCYVVIDAGFWRRFKIFYLLYILFK